MFFGFVGNMVSSEELPGSNYKLPLNEKDNPIYYKYMENYQNQLVKDFDAAKYGKREWGMNILFIKTELYLISNIFYHKTKFVITMLKN